MKIQPPTDRVTHNGSGNVHQTHETVRPATAAEMRVLAHLKARAQQAAEDYREAFLAFAPADSELHGDRWVRPVSADE